MLLNLVPDNLDRIVKKSLDLCSGNSQHS
ncbi:hypothetical protein NC653_001890 [Populus alba x Populus x berolinensis]|uniref:Uncharacterized protein n=1 Tax=Populus alba x Populus x berolinensis TaxID=444605 RepID=A0AAD6RMA3_9ROSI|nr:hypothetical protein NC653_001890 [Populus alba x Populus x berolinensis]